MNASKNIAVVNLTCPNKYVGGKIGANKIQKT